MILVALLIGAVLIVSAVRGTYGTLFADLGQDVPHFVTWAAAIVALGAIGFIPGLKPVSRGLMALVLVVLVLHNYKTILVGFQAVATPPKVPSPKQTVGISILQATPHSAYATDGQNVGSNG